MPKRDDAYMRAQRDLIARAALRVLLEKGVYATSLRDICASAGVSIGSLYTHFTTKEDAITAACALDYLDHEGAPPAPDWTAYLDGLRQELHQLYNPTRQKRYRLSLQFVAELMMMERPPEGLAQIYFIYRSSIASSLAQLRDKGEIGLPLGLEVTADIHMQMIAGAVYRSAADRDCPLDQIDHALATGLALTAGLTDRGRQTAQN
ncbi:MAG TPA: helix-turn-helix domain-containing protein [Caulobacteraceae bacterium]|jgi:AcrR family transcriptional regulator|nr:helix-turn-helix domain-containing protein [Caulobacteraceae bacterium]